MEQTPSTEYYLKLVDELFIDYNITASMRSILQEYATPIYRSEREKRFSEPMFWIGLYIALASFVCILAMMADLIHGFHNRKLWFPCKYFRINSAFLTIISVAMKLPLDLSGSMPGDVDQVGKLGSMAFMCTMMANLLPCLSTMDNNSLFSNITALCLLVITLVVNVCIQIQTGVVSYKEAAPVLLVIQPDYEMTISTSRNIVIASIYVTLLLWLLIIHVCSCLAILKSKKIIESKYQKCHKEASKDIQQSPGELLAVDKLKRHVCNHWIMAGSGSPQFITTCFPTTSSSGVICVFVTVLHTLTMFWSISAIFAEDSLQDLQKHCDSNYGLSMIVIVLVQSIGVVVGTLAPLSRCFATLSFKVSLNIVSNHFKVFKLQSYWTSKLHDLKRTSLEHPKLQFRSHRLKVAIETLKKLILSFCIEFQEGVVVVCMIIALIPFVFMICVWYCFRRLKRLYSCFLRLKRLFSILTDDELDYDALRPYVLQLEDDMELAERTMEGLSKSVNQLIKNGEKSKQNNNLMELIKKHSTGDFKGVLNFDHINHQYDFHHVPFFLLLKEEKKYQDCWSLPVVSLTTIALSLFKVEEKKVCCLLESVREGLVYVALVEENLNATDEYEIVHEAAKALWKEVDIDHEWLGHKLQLDSSSQVKTAREIVEWFKDKAKNIVYSDDTSKDNDFIGKSMCANSMYRITKTILLTYQANADDEISQKELFDSLSSMISDIMAACLTNLPRVITIKCHTKVIEEREARVKGAAQLVGECTQIIETLKARGVPKMNPSDLPFIQKWRAYLGNP